MINDRIIKAHRIAAFLAATSPESTPFFGDFCEIFQSCSFYKDMTQAESMEAQADLKMRLEFLNDMKVSQDFVMVQVLQEILMNLAALNAKKE